MRGMCNVEAYHKLIVFQKLTELDENQLSNYRIIKVPTVL